MTVVTRQFDNTEQPCSGCKWTP